MARKNFCLGDFRTDPHVFGFPLLVQVCGGVVQLVRTLPVTQQAVGSRLPSLFDTAIQPEAAVCRISYHPGAVFHAASVKVPVQIHCFRSNHIFTIWVRHM